MPIIAVESSARLPAAERVDALRSLVATVNELLAIAPPTQLRLRIVDVPVESMAIGDAVADPDEPWVVAFVHVLEGRPPAQIAAFMDGFTEALAATFRVDAAKVRVLVTPVAKTNWQIGRRSAAAIGR